jgi:hypothetical protein
MVPYLVQCYRNEPSSLRHSLKTITRIYLLPIGIKLPECSNLA